MTAAVIVTLVLAFSSDFWPYWGDGKAEISTYASTQSRYGQEREAEVALIYVTEPFNLRRQVKSDAAATNDPNVINVLKLNRVKKFQTGIYDYSLMSSVFTPLEAYRLGDQRIEAGAALKMTFTSQEWCGQTFQQLNRTASGMNSRSFSYFESEGDQSSDIETVSGALWADELFIAVRELIRPMPTGNIILYQTLETGRLFHRPMQAMEARVTRSRGSYSWDGIQRDVQTFLVEADDKQWRFTVEEDYPRKIFAYEYREGSRIVENATLKQSRRLPYWSLNDNADQKYLRELGL